MSKKKKSYSAEFKLDAVSRMAQAKTITGLAKELGIRRKFLYTVAGSAAGRRQGGAGATPGSTAREPLENCFPANAQCSRIADR